MSNTYFITGFPGFLAGELMREIIRENKEIGHIYLLCLPNMREKADYDLNVISDETGLSINNFTIVTGDITKPNIGVTEEFTQKLKSVVTHAFHLAAIYDLAVDKNSAELVNVNGTRNVTEFVDQMKNIARYIYFSTAYVSGKREGRIYEKELVMNQQFKNHYERTKYEAEVIVRDRMNDIPTTIIRPGIVRGHSITGATVKYDGPYFMLHLFDRLKFLPVIPYIGSGEAEGNFVPVDYVIRATIYLSHLPKGVNKTYHLTDPAPFLMKEVYEMLAKEFINRKPRGKIPFSIANSMMRIGTVRKWLRVERESLPYFDCHSVYDTRTARNDLRGSGIDCPRFDKTVKKMVQYYRENKHREEKYIKIY
ncbi:MULTISPECIES: SDR family oxidoreductase [Bacillaceae]|uniref:SDR family oxidoreductase n=1 Tax=Evansella alkalicola TaxID=745819 RepID=A0ABS6JRN0_9BACI|nr:MULTISPECIES: SDR family oxidoreductase [Bacillaceae]MBU9719937.1 SDR family oxidoreductase [Bacillus alkalicola]